MIDKVMPIEADILCSGRDPMVTAHDDDRINDPPTDAWAARHDEALLQQSSTHVLPVATGHRCLKLAHRNIPRIGFVRDQTNATTQPIRVQPKSRSRAKIALRVSSWALNLTTSPAIAAT